MFVADKQYQYSACFFRVFKVVPLFFIPTEEIVHSREKHGHLRTQTKYDIKLILARVDYRAEQTDGRETEPRETIGGGSEGGVGTRSGYHAE